MTIYHIDIFINLNHKMNTTHKNPAYFTVAYIYYIHIIELNSIYIILNLGKKNSFVYILKWCLLNRQLRKFHDRC